MESLGFSLSKVQPLQSKTVFYPGTRLFGALGARGGYPSRSPMDPYWFHDGLEVFRALYFLNLVRFDIPHACVFMRTNRWLFSFLFFLFLFWRGAPNCFPRKLPQKPADLKFNRTTELRPIPMRQDKTCGFRTRRLLLNLRGGLGLGRRALAPGAAAPVAQSAVEWRHRSREAWPWLPFGFSTPGKNENIFPVVRPNPFKTNRGKYVLFLKQMEAWEGNQTHFRTSGWDQTSLKFCLFNHRTVQTPKKV